jgi:SAM-dependent methyltransferase
VHRDTVEIYEANAAEYRRRRKAYDPGRAERFRDAVGPGVLRLDVGCGPGLYVPLLGRPLLATDVAPAMCAEARRADPAVPVAAHDLVALPFRDAAFAGIWAWKCLQHLPAAELPLALGELARCLVPGGRLDLAVFRSGRREVHEELSAQDDDFPGRLFTWWEPAPLAAVLDAAELDVEELAVTDRTLKATATRRD